jgi:hypothetical protein
MRNNLMMLKENWIVSSSGTYLVVAVNVIEVEKTNRGGHQ